MLDQISKVTDWLNQKSILVNSISNIEVIFCGVVLGFCIAILFSKKLRNTFF